MAKTPAPSATNLGMRDGAETAWQLGVPFGWLCRWAREGRVPGVGAGLNWLFDVAAVRSSLVRMGFEAEENCAYRPVTLVVATKVLMTELGWSDREFWRRIEEGRIPHYKIDRGDKPPTILVDLELVQAIRFAEETQGHHNKPIKAYDQLGWPREHLGEVAHDPISRKKLRHVNPEAASNAPAHAPTPGSASATSRAHKAGPSQVDPGGSGREEGEDVLGSV